MRHDFVPGVVHVRVVNDGAPEAAAVTVFQLGDLPWSVVEEFAASPPPIGPDATPPPVVLVVQVDVVQVAGRRPADGYGEAVEGQLGVACVRSANERLVITLAGPFTIGP